MGRNADDAAGLLPVQGVKAITYIATCPDKQVVLTLLCSLLNTVCTVLYGFDYCLLLTTVSRSLLSTILRHGGFHMTMWSGKTPSRSWLYTVYNFFLFSSYILSQRTVVGHRRRTIIAITSVGCTDRKTFNSLSMA